jgi:hypothetical protein
LLRMNSVMFISGNPTTVTCKFFASPADCITAVREP